MTDEKNITPQPSGDGREVISWYVPPERGNEVVRCYVQPQPLPQGVRPQPPQMAPQRGKKRGWIIFVILAAVLAAINLADELFKQQEGSENLRRQLKTYLDEASRAKSEAAELRRKLQNQQGRKG